jgi:hypothetical protein
VHCRKLLDDQNLPTEDHRRLTRLLGQAEARLAVGAALSVEPVTNAWKIVITDGATTHQAIDVLEEARLYWYHFLSKLGLMDD